VDEPAHHHVRAHRDAGKSHARREAISRPSIHSGVLFRVKRLVSDWTTTACRERLAQISFRLGHRVVRFDRRGNRVLLWQVSFEKRADGAAIQNAVDSANMDSIIWSTNVEAEGKDRSVVINATPLFMNDLPDFSVKNAFGQG